MIALHSNKTHLPELSSCFRSTSRPSVLAENGLKVVMICRLNVITSYSAVGLVAVSLTLVYLCLFQ